VSCSSERSSPFVVHALLGVRFEMLKYASRNTLYCAIIFVCHYLNAVKLRGEHSSNAPPLVLV
jgi:hypothetical protein